MRDVYRNRNMIIFRLVKLLDSSFFLGFIALKLRWRLCFGQSEGLNKRVLQECGGDEVVPLLELT